VADLLLDLRTLLMLAPTDAAAVEVAPLR